MEKIRNTHLGKKKILVFYKTYCGILPLKMVAKFEYFFSVYSKEATSKLEQDYIQMYLGELSPIQESQLVQLKSWVSDLLKGKVPSDPVMLRFLRARDFSVEKGESCGCADRTRTGANRTRTVLSKSSARAQLPAHLLDFYFWKKSIYFINFGGKFCTFFVEENKKTQRNH